jgi:diguanylate cyclase (GGDEF)-like protein/PAS domain S-box-containing protein
LPGLGQGVDAAQRISGYTFPWPANVQARFLAGLAAHGLLTSVVYPMMGSAVQGHLAMSTHRLAQATRNSLRRQTLYTDVCRAALAHAGVQVAWLGQVEPHAAGLRCCACETVAPHVAPDAVGTVVDAVLASGAALWCQPLAGDDADFRALHAQGWRAVAAVPLFVERSVGAVLMLYATDAVFTPALQRQLLGRVAACGHALTALVAGPSGADLSPPDLQPFKTLFGNSSWGIATTNPQENVFTYVNQAFAKMHGYRVQEMVGMDLRDTFTADSLARLPAYIAQAHSQGQVVFSADHKRQDGTVFPCEIQLVAHKDGAGRVLYRAAICIDISERRRIEAQNSALLAAAHDARELLDEVFGRVNDGIVSLDSDWRYQYLNQRAATMLQRQAPENLLGKNIWEEYPEGVGQPFYHAYHAALAEQKVIVIEQHYEPWDLWFENRIYPSKNGLTIYFTEITARKKAEIELRQAASLFESTRDAVVFADLSAKAISVNPAFCQVTGYTTADIIGHNVSKVLASDAPRSEQPFWQPMVQAGYWQGELLYRRKNGDCYPAEMTITTITDAAGDAINYLCVFSDISEVKRNQAQLEWLAHYDALTGLPNRSMLALRLEHAIDVARREGRLLAVLMLDLDRFKDVNDSFGHAVGDELLGKIAGKLAARFRAADTVCRLGGDEFVILLEDLACAEDAARVAGDVIALVSRQWRLSNEAEVRVGCSVGISLCPDHGASASELLQHGDTALYQAKGEGRGRFTFYSAELTRLVVERIGVESRLRKAVKRQELVLHFQPKVAMQDQCIVGAEALVRWQCPQEGLIYPDRFIAIAESTGLIVDLGNWVLREACRVGQQWRTQGFPDLAMAVNLSPLQFLHSDIVALVSDTLAATGFPAGNLELELTESTLMARETEAIEILQALRALGVRVAIDDFGTGYSSLAYLTKLPLDVLKIDKSFIDPIPHSTSDMTIAATIIAMAQKLGLLVLAEGVETPEQFTFLANEGCDLFQGYLFSPAVVAADFEALLRKQPYRSL